jgi:hypothetical protein
MNNKIEWIQIKDSNGKVIGCVSKEWNDYVYELMNDYINTIIKNIDKEISSLE